MFLSGGLQSGVVIFLQLDCFISHNFFFWSARILTLLLTNLNYCNLNEDSLSVVSLKEMYVQINVISA